jgi:hypothetical protein
LNSFWIGRFEHHHRAKATVLNVRLLDYFDQVFEIVDESHGRHAAISMELGFLWMAAFATRFPFEMFDNIGDLYFTEL